MDKASLYATKQLSKLPGVSMNPMLHPQSIPIRTRKAVQRMILLGAIDGTWSSKSARLAQILCNEFSLPHVRTYWTEVYVPSYTPLAIRLQIEKLFVACCATNVIDGETISESRRQLNETKRAQLTSHFNTVDVSLSFPVPELRRQALALLVTDKESSESLARRKYVAGLLDSADPIKLSLKSAV